MAQAWEMMVSDEESQVSLTDTSAASDPLPSVEPLTVGTPLHILRATVSLTAQLPSASRRRGQLLVILSYAGKGAQRR